MPSALVWVRLLSLGCRQPPSHVSSHGLSSVSVRGRGGEGKRERERERSLVSPPLTRTPVLLFGGGTTMTSFNLNYLLKGSVSKYTLRSGLQYN